MMKIDELTKDYILLSELSQKSKLSDEEVFKWIGDLDIKYKDIDSHFISFEGLISNIGSDQKSIPILNYALKRLQDKKESLDKNKFYYDFGNTLFSKATIELSAVDDFDNLVDLKTYREARQYFLKVKKDQYGHYERARTNLAIIYERYGRNYEAINAFDQVIKASPTFGMAYGGKAVSLEYYTRLAPQQSLHLINISYNLLLKALLDNSLVEIGSRSSFEYYESKKKQIEKFFESVEYSPIEINPPESISKYQKFILSNNLFLNYDFGYYYDKDSLCDNFFPNLIEKINEEKFDKTQTMSKKTYFCFQTFNQLLEDFTTARYNFFQSLNLNHKRIDSRVKYIYTLDYTQHSLKYGILKSVFATLYNCLDKIANIIQFYFSDEEIDINKIDVYFDWFTKDVFKNLVKEKRDFQLLAFYSLAIDMKNGGSYYHLNRIRNRITHSFLNINVDIGFDEKYADFEVTEDYLISGIHDLFVIVKAAIMYLLIGIRNTNDPEKTMPMYATMEYDIYK
ncbi:LA2681 family HEPN domain-containing protein [Desulfobacterium sp. N47]|uniref:LA2681 family HEPN domain-containing protein n=1 Tax=Desulfobacterium sp. N47 TaxID=3115210 RepID=UPI003F4A3D6B